MNAVSHERKIVGSRWVHSCKWDELGNNVKSWTKSRMVAKMSTHMLNVDYHETTPPTPASAPVKIVAVAGNELGLPVFHLNVSQAFVQAPLQERMYMCLPPGCGKPLGKIVRLLKCQYGKEQAGRKKHNLLVRWLSN